MPPNDDITRAAREAASTLTALAAEAARELSKVAQTATLELTSVTRELSGDVKQLGGEVREMSASFREHLARTESGRKELDATKTEVFGIDGDPARPGLKGQMRDARKDIEENRTDLHDHKEAVRNTMTRVWGFIAGLAVVLLGDAAKAAFEYFSQHHP